MTHATLTRFFLISLLAHAGLLLSWPESPPTASTSTPVTATGGAPLQLALKALPPELARQPESTPPRSEPEPAKASALPAEAAASVRPRQPDETIAAARTAMQEGRPEVRAPRSSPAPVAAGQEAGEHRADRIAGIAGEAEVRARIGEAVETYFYYPPLARRRGWEGEVVVGLRVDADGRISAIEVVASSGYRVLDSAAVDSLTRLARLPESGDLPEAGIELTLPVRYRLLDRPA